jgi:hypothetical protein
MSESVEEKRAQRLAFMRRLYERTNGEQLEEIPQETLANDLGWDLKTANRVFNYLINEGLAACASYGGEVSITHKGVLEVERALTEPNLPTEHFPPAVTVHFHGNVVGSQVQAGTVRSSQHQVSPEIDRERALHVVNELRNVLAHGGVDPAVRAQGEASLVAVEAQLNLEKPNAGLLREGLQSLRAIGENLVASGIWIGGAEMLKQLPPFS